MGNGLSNGIASQLTILLHFKMESMRRGTFSCVINRTKGIGMLLSGLVKNIATKQLTPNLPPPPPSPTHKSMQAACTFNVIYCHFSLDLRGIGPGTDYPYLCVEFDRKNDHVNFDMPAGPLVACSEYTAPTGECVLRHCNRNRL